MAKPSSLQTGSRDTAQDIRDLVEQFPRPAFLLGPNGQIITASKSADELIAATDGAAADSGISTNWWHILTNWLYDKNRSQSGSLTSHITGAGEDGGDMVLEWQAMPLSNGTIAVLSQDNSLHLTLNQALAESRQRFKELAELSGDFTWECDSAGFLSYVSSAGALGFNANDLIGRPAHRILATDMNEGTSPFETHSAIDGRDVWMVRQSGDYVTQTVWARPFYDKSGNWRGARGVCRDISRSRRLEQQIARAQVRERLLTHILKSMREELRPEMSLATAAKATVHAIAADGACILRTSPMEIGQTVADFAVLPPGEAINARLPQDLAARMSINDLSISQPTRIGLDDAEAMVAVSRFRGRPVGLLAVWRRTVGERQMCVWDEDDGHVIQTVADQLGLAHEQMAHYEELQSLAQRDGLTGLFNRRAFIENVEEKYAACRPDQMQAVAYLDIDNFKGVNDHYGHQEGDIIIREVAALIADLTKSVDIAARIGGDEFVIWLNDTDDNDIQHFARAVQMGAREIAGRYTDVEPPGISVGIAIRDQEGETCLDSMIDRADRAMYEAKRNKSKVRGGRVRISTEAGS